MAHGREITPRTYVTVGALLVALTVLTAAVSFIPLHGPWHIVVGLAIGLCKASLVLLFFMHVLISGRLTWAVIAVACFWLGILLVLTLTDYFTRGAAGWLFPGH
jgi:cytochrome c oxidase subunit 4